MNSDRLVLGCAQLGMNYGITNRTGKMERKTALNMIQYCLENGITQFDTARVYGNSEDILGEALENRTDIRIITKLKKIPEGLTQKEVMVEVEHSLEQSRSSLRRQCLQTLLLHCWTSYKSYDNLVWNYLKVFQNTGLIRQIGVSVYSVDEAIDVLKDKRVTHLQIPMNILDQQWRSKEFLELVGKRLDVVIHVRSIYLQGILISDEKMWPKLRNINTESYVQKINGLVDQFKLSGRKELCVAYAKSFGWINGIIVGADNLKQLRENAKLFRTNQLTVGQRQIVQDTFKNTPNFLVNPSLWDSYCL